MNVIATTEVKVCLMSDLLDIRFLLDENIVNAKFFNIPLAAHVTK